MTYLCHISEMTRTNVTFWVVRVIIRVEKSVVLDSPKIQTPSRGRILAFSGVLLCILIDAVC